MNQSYWTIQKKDGQKVGPISSSEVRESLRKGTIDLFDWIYKDSSKLTIRVLDVDEIFKESIAGASDSVYREEDNFTSSQYNQTKLNNQPPQNGSFSRQDSPALTTRITSSFGTNGNDTSSGRSYERISSHIPQKLNDKKYYVSNKPGSYIGPLTSTEIVQKYFKHSFPKDLFVLIKSSPIKVKMEEFVKTFMKYQTSTSKDIMLNNLFKERKASKNLDNNLSSNSSKKSRTATLMYKLLGTVSILGVLVFAVLVAYPRTRINLARSTKDFSYSIKRAPMSSEEEVRQVMETTPSYQTSTPTSVVEPSSQQLAFDDEMTITPIQPSKPKTQAKVSKKQDTKKLKDLKKNKNTKNKQSKKTKEVSDYQTEAKQFLAPSITPNPTPNTNRVSSLVSTSNLEARNVQDRMKNKNTQRIQPKSQPNQQQQMARIQPQPQTRPQLLATNSQLRSTPTSNTTVASNYKKPATNASSQVSTATPISKDKLVPGTVVTLPNMEFSQIELNICPNKCTLNFYSNSLNIKGTFFKAAYMSVLKNKSRVSVTGTVMKNGSGYKLIIQNIK